VGLLQLRSSSGTPTAPTYLPPMDNNP
jgi:hypothetical protein